MGEEIEGDKATVTASIPLERETVTISYDLHRRENQWRIYDLTIDGTSTAEGNRRRYERYKEEVIRTAHRTTRQTAVSPPVGK